MDARIEMAQIAGLRTLFFVVEAASITGAAKRLGVTASSVSRHITRLEESLGARLLERTTRRLRPTPAGMELYQRTRPLFEALSAATSGVGEREREIAGWVRISSSPAFGRSRLLAVLQKLADVHPGLRFDLVLTARRLDFVEDDIDVAIREGRLADSSLTARRLPDAHVVLCASTAYLAAAGTPRRIDDLARHSLLLMPTQSVPTALRRRFGIDRAVTRFRVDDLFALRQLAESGAGIAPLPDYLLAEPLAEGRLVRVLPKVVVASIPMHVVHPTRRLVSRRVAVLLEALAASNA